MGPTDSHVYDERSVELLSSVLISSNVIDRFDLNWAVREAERKARPLLDVLVELELVTPHQLQSCFESLQRTGKIQT
ncbi:MAG TPA: hypothetical protein ENO21_02440 [Firmicutes bacterium]|nr:hypothetical protein [Bacillota bacterium]